MRDPSGEKALKDSNVACPVSFRTAPVATSRTTTPVESTSPKCGEACRVNTMNLPSGDHETGGKEASPGSVCARLQPPDVSRRALSPFAAAGMSHRWNGSGAALVRNPSFPTSKPSW